MNKVCDDHAPIIVTRQNSSPVVMMSLEDYNAIEETLYLFRSPQNTLRLHQALKEYADGQRIQKDLIEI